MAAGAAALELCLHLDAMPVFFHSVFAKFEEGGARGTFLELLVPYILHDRLPTLPPEVTTRSPRPTACGERAYA
eukprot:1195505-Prorocentrum_minimum.AAC.3